MYRKGVTAKQIEHKTMIQKFLHIAIYMLVFTRMDYSSTLVRVFTEGTLSGQLFTLCTQLFTLTIYKVSFHKKKDCGAYVQWGWAIYIDYFLRPHNSRASKLLMLENN